MKFNQSIRWSALTALTALAALTAMAFSPAANAVPVVLTKLAGITGGSVAGTAVYKANLSTVGLGSILSIGIRDNSGGLGGAGGQFSGFDLDAIKLSTADCANAACASAAGGLSVFDFLTAVVFHPGIQRIPADAKLFGTDASGNAVNNAVATLGAFDGESTTVTPFGFLSMGDNGSIDFNLTSAAATAGLFLYIGEVGDNGEVAAGEIVVRDVRTVPEPGGLALAMLGLTGAGMVLRRRPPSPRG